MDSDRLLSILYHTLTKNARGEIQMDNFKAIYKMLSALERAMDLPAFSVESFGLDSMQVSGERLYRYLEMHSGRGAYQGRGALYRRHGRNAPEE